MGIEMAIYNFVTGIECKSKENKPTYEEAYKRAFQLAWKDMATHTLKISDEFKENKYDRYFNGESKLKKGNKERLKEQLADIIKVEFDKLLTAKDKDSFDDAHKRICEYIVDDFPKCEIEYHIDKNDKEKVIIKDLYAHMDNTISETFSYGQAQKLVNMLVKYMYIYHKIYSFDCKDGIFLDKVELYHVPIDSYVLQAIEDKSAWSKIKCYEHEYNPLQKKISEKANKQGYSNPFEWELDNWNTKFKID